MSSCLLMTLTRKTPLLSVKKLLVSINRKVRIIIDREEAIKTAMSETIGSSDALVIAGKGS